MVTRRGIAATAVVAAMTLLAACSSSGGGTSSSTAGAASSSTAGGATSSSSTSSGSIAPLKVGILIDETGASAPAWTGYQTAIKIAFDAINNAGGVNGQKLSYVLADSETSSPATLSAVQGLVERDKVSVVLPMANFFYAVEPYLLQQGIPAIGTASDAVSTEYQDKSDTNLFDAVGTFDKNGVYPAVGQFVKDNGGTVCGAVGASTSPVVTLQAEQFIAECQAAGLKVTPVNSSLPFGSTDVGALALQLKSEGVNALFLPLLTTEAFPLLAQLKELGADIKLPILRTGYASSTLSDPATRKAAQGYVFDLTAAPAELNTPGVKAFNAAMAAAGQSGPPSYAETTIWAEVQALKAGLEKYGKPNPTPAQLTTALRSVTDFDDGGLLSPEKINFSQYNTKTNCTWFVKLTGDAFVPYPGTPSCSTATKDISS